MKGGGSINSGSLAQVSERGYRTGNTSQTRNSEHRFNKLNKQTYLPKSSPGRSGANPARVNGRGSWPAAAALTEDALSEARPGISRAPTKPGAPSGRGAGAGGQGGAAGAGGGRARGGRAAR